MPASLTSTGSFKSSSAGKDRSAVDIEWLDGLETRVREAVARLGELSEENRTLRARVKDLETRLAVASTPPAAPAEAGEAGEELENLRARLRDLEEQIAGAETERAEAAAAARSWEVEREEVRRRVEGLVERLEGLAEG
jgi:chromosome segregation ATPase